MNVAPITPVNERNNIHFGSVNYYMIKNSLKSHEIQNTMTKYINKNRRLNPVVDSIHQGLLVTANKEGSLVDANIIIGKKKTQIIFNNIEKFLEGQSSRVRSELSSFTIKNKFFKNEKKLNEFFMKKHNDLKNKLGDYINKINNLVHSREYNIVMSLDCYNLNNSSIRH